MKRLILSPNPFPVANSAKQRNTGCISDRDAQSGTPGLSRIRFRERGAEGFGDFMNNPDQVYLVTLF